MGRPEGCIRRGGTSEAAPAAVGQAVGGGCQSGWGRLLSVTNAGAAGTCRQGDSGWAFPGRPGVGGEGGYLPPPSNASLGGLHHRYTPSSHRHQLLKNVVRKPVPRRALALASGASARGPSVVSAGASARAEAHRPRATQCGAAPPPAHPQRQHRVVGGGLHAKGGLRAERRGTVLCVWGGGRSDALERRGPPRRPQKRMDRRLEEVAIAIGGGYCRLQMPLRLALGVTEDSGWA